MNKDNLTLKNLPYGEMEKVGLTKDEFLNYPKQELEAMLQGGSSRHCLRIPKKGYEEDHSHLAFFGFEQTVEGNTALRFEHIPDSLLCDDELLPLEKRKLESGHIVSKVIRDGKGYPVKVLMQRSSLTGEVIKVRESNILPLPAKIHGRAISPATRQAIINADSPMMMPTVEGNVKIWLDLDCPEYFRVQIRRHHFG